MLAFGLIEVGIGAGALLGELVLRAYGFFYPALHATLAGRPALFLAAKTVLAVLAVRVRFQAPRSVTRQTPVARVGTRA